MEKVTNKRLKQVMGSVFMFGAFVLMTPNSVVYGAEDPGVGTSSDDIESMITVGKSLMNQTPYVYGGGHSDWEEQKQLDVPTGLDNSSFVSWVLYRGMGIDMGVAPIAGNFDQYFDTVSVGSLEGVQRGDLISDDRQIEIYLGEDESGKHYSLSATNDRNNVGIIETNWGNGVETKEVIRPSIEFAKTGKNGLSYDASVVIDGGIGEGAIGDGSEPTREATDNGTVNEIGDIGDAEGNGTEEGGDKEKTETNQATREDDLFSWLNPIVDFTGASDSHAKSNPEGKKIDGSNKGLKGHKKGIFDSIF